MTVLQHISKPTSTPSKFTMSFALFFDRGNYLLKYLIENIGKTQSAATTARSSMSSAVVELSAPEWGTVQLAKKKSVHYLVGNQALTKDGAIRHTPMDDADKIRNLSAFVATLVGRSVPPKVAPGDIHINLSIVLSSPRVESEASVKSESKKLAKELFKLEDGFTYGGRTFSVSLGNMLVLAESLPLIVVNDEFDGVIDLGSGTLRAGYRSAVTHDVVSVPLLGGNTTACDSWIEAATRHKSFDGVFGNKQQRGHVPIEAIANQLAQGKYIIAGVDIRPALRATGKNVLNNIINAASSVRGKLIKDAQKDISLDASREFKIALIGGGAALLRGVFGCDYIAKLEKSRNLTIFQDRPEYRTVLSMRAHYGQLVSDQSNRIAQYADFAPRRRSK